MENTNTDPQPFNYVVADPNTRTLLESCYQVPAASHETACVIPVDEAVRENWLQYQANATLDGVELIPPTPAPTPSPAQVVAGYMADVQKHLDAEAVRFGYDNIVSVVSYADEPAVPRYQTEGQAFRTWRSKVWAYCEQVKTDVDAGTRTQPTGDALIAELDANVPLGIEPSTAVTAPVQ